ncbi:MAG: helicase-related protein [Ignavibacteria bacterium]
MNKKEHFQNSSNNAQENRNLPLDLTFIVNETNRTLKDRFEELIKDCKFFDCLAAYFYISGFHKIYKPLQKTERIRILIGIGTTKATYSLIKDAKDNPQSQGLFSHARTKQEIENIVGNEMADSEDSLSIEEGTQKFIEWIKQNKLQIRAYPSENLHAKLYIMTFTEGDRDIGRVITGSSNFTEAGLIDNLEFNVELKNRADYEFAKQKFEELWQDAVDVSDKYIQTIEEKTWLNQNITPYQLYLKFLYEYFKDELRQTDELFVKYLPENFRKFEYQEQAVLNSKRILEEYGGVFISDVVGLGKTYMTAMLCGQLDGRTLVIAPPALLKKSNPGSWLNVFSDFRVPADFESIGKLEDIIERGTEKYSNIIIDEAHRFRTETTLSYEDVAEICRGKRVILVSATPYNNSPQDILAQIKLFQNVRRSTIPGIPNLEDFFKKIETKINNIDRQKHYNEYIKLTRQCTKEIRDKVLKHIMVRRTRTEIVKYFENDLKKNSIKFPEVEDPKPFYYQLNDEEDKIFMQTIELITGEFKYVRYTPLLYLKESISAFEAQSQKNMVGFMKILLVKRLESSFYAFQKTLDRFINSYKMFIEEYENGNVYVSKKYINKIFELLEDDDDEAIQKLIDEGKAERYSAWDFIEEFESLLKNDYKILKDIKSLWENIKRDPKLETLIEQLKNNFILKEKKIIIFTESKETAEYLGTNINKVFNKEVALVFHGSTSEIERDKVIENFDARARNKKDDYRILVSTEVLSEGVNLHQSNIVINYDIPWNPTRLMQRVGRINRIDTPFNKIYVFNFFPTKQADSEIELTRIARSKIEAFLTLLGGDSAILTEGEPVSSHELFDRLLSKKTFTEDEGQESELKYLRVIEDIRDNNPDLFEQIKKLPKKARSAKAYSEALGNITQSNSLITYFRKGKLMKFFLSDKTTTVELDFLTAAKILECAPEEKKEKLHLGNYYELLIRNKDAFLNSTLDEIIEIRQKGGKSSEDELLKILKATQKNSKQLTEDQEEYLKKVISQIEAGSLPKQTIKKTLKALNTLKQDIQNPLKVIGILQREISTSFLKSHYAETSAITEGKREVILSLYLSE